MEKHIKQYFEQILMSQQDQNQTIILFKGKEYENMELF